MDTKTLHDLQQKAVETALKTGTIEDIEKAVNITKQTVDTEKAIIENENEPKTRRYEEFKTWATLIVPLLSIATLAVTIYIQASQLKASRESNEDTEWRETVKNVLSQLNKPRAALSDPAMAMSLLEPYSREGRHSLEAKQLSVGLLSRVPSSDRFKDYFVSHHIGESQADVAFLTDLNRELYNDLAEVEGRLNQPSPPPILQPARDAIVGDIEYVTGKLCALYRASGNAISADLRDVFLVEWGSFECRSDGW